ncbi:MAG TPA: hypothetical protein VF975_09650, partial [Thermoanaerobaculia bacterium]
LPVEPLHPSRQGFGRELNDEVKMVRHQHVCGKNPIEPLYGGAKEGEEEFTILVTPKNILTRIAARGDVVQGSRILNSKRS